MTCCICRSDEKHRKRLGNLLESGHVERHDEDSRITKWMFVKQILSIFIGANWLRKESTLLTLWIA